MIRRNENKRKTHIWAFGIMAALCLSACGGANSEEVATETENLVYTMTELDANMDLSELYFCNICNGKLCYISDEELGEVTQLSVPELDKQVTKLVWSEDYQIGLKDKIRLEQIAVGDDGSIYVVALLPLSNNNGNFTPFLCKFNAEGQMVYAQRMSDMMREVDEKGWSSRFQLEVDSQGRAYISHEYKVFLYDENGEYKESIEVIAPEDTLSYRIYDMSPGRDGKMYLYYPDKGYGNIAEIDFAERKFINVQEVTMGDNFCFDVEDGFYVSSGESLFFYATDLPTVNRMKEEQFCWWDFLIYEDNINQIAVTGEGKLLVVVSGTQEERSGVFLFEQIPQAKKQ